MVEVSPIRSAKDHKAALAEVKALVDKAKLAKAERDRLDVLTVLVSDYEDHAFPHKSGGSPAEFLKTCMASSGRTQADFAKLIDNRSIASLVLARKRTMSIDVIRALVTEWKVPAGPLIVRDKLAEKRQQEASGRSKAKRGKAKSVAKRKTRRRAAGKSKPAAEAAPNPLED